MAIECSLWPMNFLTKPVGSKDRKLICHPKDGILRSGIRRDKNGQLKIIDEKAIKIKNGIYYPEVKESGHRHLYCRDSKGKYHVYGRRLNVNQTYTDILPKLKGMHLPDIPNLSVIDFEMVWPGHPDSEVSTAIKECSNELEMIAFSIPIWKDNILIDYHSSSWKEGRSLLKRTLHGQHIQMSCAFKPITLDDNNKCSILTSLLHQSEKKGLEGFVLKGKACDMWWKLKGINEADVFVIGFKVSDSETRKGMVTAIKIAVYDGDGWKPMGNVAGFNLQQMSDMTVAYNKYKESKANPFMFRVARVIYQEIAGKGMMKHGFFDCWRNDKKSTSCTMEQFR